MRIISSIILAALMQTAVVFGQAANVPQYDLVIVNARIVDGTGNPWFRGSIAVKDGRIVRVATFSPDAGTKTTVIDAKNNIVAPGFIDVHAHTENIYDQPTADNFIRMGVTTLVTGNCGGSHLDVGKFLGDINTKPLAINISTLIGHNTVRTAVLGLDDRQPTPDEQAKMNELVAKAMRDGAVGFSTGLIYLPGTFAKTAEVAELAKAASQYGGTYASHIRDEMNGVAAAIKEAIDIGEQSKMPTHISHFKIQSKALWGQTPMTLGLVRSARDRGVPVTVDQYAYTASSTSLDARLPTWLIAGGRDEGRKRLADPATRKRAAAEMTQALKDRKFADFSFAYVASYGAHPEFNGKNIAEITQALRRSKKVDAQIEQMFEMYEKGGAQMVYRMMNEDDVRNIMAAPFTMIAADAGIQREGPGVPHPRGFGNNARVLGHYVRELKVITLEDAVRKMTSLPAQTFGMRDRGMIREGFAADIVIFDEKIVGDRATFEAPRQFAQGFTHVIVNGGLVFDGQTITPNRPGQAIRGPLAETRP